MINANIPFVVLGIVILVWNLGLTVIYLVNWKLFGSLTKGVTSKNLIIILKEIVGSLQGASTRIEELEII